MIKGLGHMAVTVRDMPESVRFYTRALGLKKAFEFSHPETGRPWIVYLNAAPGQFIELFYGGSEEQARNDRQIGFSHLCLHVDDIGGAVRAVRDAGYAVDSEPKQGLDRNWQAWVTDPNGIRIELMQIMPDSPQSRFF